MKIAVKLLSAVAVGALCLGTTQVMAQSASGSATMPMPSMPVAAAAESPVSTAPLEAKPAISAAVSDGIVVSPSSAKSFDSLSDREVAAPKVPDSIKNVIKNLNSSNTTGPATLDDLNTAREALAKLDVLIDIEKRLTDLAQIRRDRDAKSGTGLSAISASALMPRATQKVLPSALSLPSSPAPSASSSFIAEPAAKGISSGKVSVERIFGATGHYSAKLRIGEGSVVTVKEGDKLADGSVVKSITGSGVRLVSGKEERTINVKNVVSVFGGVKQY